MYFSARTEHQLLYAAIRYLPREKEHSVPVSEWFAVLKLISRQTPRQFMRIFPVSKEYDGRRWQSKDYFTTMEMIERIGMDTPIGNAFEFLWDYVNLHTRTFLAAFICAVDLKRREQGEQGIIEQFFDEQGVSVPVYRKIDVCGKTIMQNTATGETHAVVKPKSKMPRWWKVIEGQSKEAPNV